MKIYDSGKINSSLHVLQHVTNKKIDMGGTFDSHLEFNLHIMTKQIKQRPKKKRTFSFPRASFFGRAWIFFFTSKKKKFPRARIIFYKRIVVFFLFLFFLYWFFIALLIQYRNITLCHIYKWTSKKKKKKKKLARARINFRKKNYEKQSFFFFLAKWIFCNDKALLSTSWNFPYTKSWCEPTLNTQIQSGRHIE